MICDDFGPCDPPNKKSFNQSGWPVDDLIPVTPLDKATALLLPVKDGVTLATTIAKVDYETLAQIKTAALALCHHAYDHMDKPDTRGFWQRVLRRPQDQHLKQLSAAFARVTSKLPRCDLKDACETFNRSAQVVFYIGRASQAGANDAAILGKNADRNHALLQSYLRKACAAAADDDLNVVPHLDEDIRHVPEEAYMAIRARYAQAVWDSSYNYTYYLGVPNLLGVINHLMENRKNILGGNVDTLTTAAISARTTPAVIAQRKVSNDIAM